MQILAVPPATIMQPLASCCKFAAVRILSVSHDVQLECYQAHFEGVNLARDTEGMSHLCDWQILRGADWHHHVCPCPNVEGCHHLHAQPASFLCKQIPDTR